MSEKVASGTEILSGFVNIWTPKVGGTYGDEVKESFISETGV